MKLCPKCQANVEGLVGYCDCCGASLDTQTHLFTCVCHDFPECLGFASLTFSMLDEIEPTDPSQYTGFLEKIAFELFCYPESIINAEKISNRVFFSAKRKYARVTVVVDYDDYVFADQNEKVSLIANAILQGIQLLHGRLQKYKVDIDEIVSQAHSILNKKLVSN